MVGRPYELLVVLREVPRPARMVYEGRAAACSGRFTESRAR